VIHFDVSANVWMEFLYIPFFQIFFSLLAFEMETVNSGSRSRFWREWMRGLGIKEPWIINWDSQAIN